MSNRELANSIYRSPYRKRTRAEKIGLGISLLAFFGAVGVIAWFGITGIGEHDDGRQHGPLVFAGGDVAQAQDAPASEAGTGENGVADEDYFVGDFGEPADELYADDADGGWGSRALGNSDTFEERPERPHREGRIRRGQAEGGD